ncbi:hypothetical protein Hanom_Chr01g00066521 [Helianthus anomalus]
MSTSSISEHLGWIFWCHKPYKLLTKTLYFICQLHMQLFAPFLVREIPVHISVAWSDARVVAGQPTHVA